MSFDEIFDLTAGVYYNFYNIYVKIFLKMTPTYSFHSIQLRDRKFTRSRNSYLQAVWDTPIAGISGRVSSTRIIQKNIYLV